MGRLHTLIRARLWSADPPRGWLARSALIAGRYGYGLIRELAVGEISLRATGLVYTTMLAVVPLFAVSFSVAKGLGYHRQLEPLLLEFLRPVGPRAAEVTGNIIGFVDNISGSLLVALGIPLLLFNVLTMAQKVESSFNYVWRVDRPRSLSRRIGDYTSVIVLGPIVMILATTTIAAISSTTVVQRLGEFGPLASWLELLGELVPYLFVIVAFCVLYVLIPNTRVRFRPALIGAVVGGVVWVTAGKLFALTIVSSTRFEAIYSGFAIVLVLMLWLHLSWLILLFGSQLSYFVQYPYQLSQAQHADTINARIREGLAFAIMRLIGRDFETSGHGWREESLAAELRVPRAAISAMLADLLDDGLIAESADGRLLPGRDLRKILLSDILAAIRGGTIDDVVRDPQIDAVTAEVEAAIATALDDRTLADLLDDAPAFDGRQGHDTR